MPLDHVLTPSLCPACEVPARSLCAHCRDELYPWQATGCLRCGARAGASCLCPELPDAVAWVQSLWRYDGPVGDLIEHAKYRGQLWRLFALRSEVGAWLASHRRLAPRRAAIVPVPPSPRRLRRRGYDLPTILAGWADPWRGWGVRAGRLRRRLDLDPQAGLPRDVRRARLAGAFEARRGADRAVLLVDDVLTTGATVSACAQALAAAGVAWIGVLTLARVEASRADAQPRRAGAV